MTFTPPASKKVFTGILYDVYQWPQVMYDGSVATFERLKRPDVALILAITQDQKIIVNFESQPIRGSFVSIPGGRVDPGESPEQAASRELLKETGYSGELSRWFSISPSNKIEYQIHFWIARGCQKIQDQKLDSGEKIQTKLVDFQEFLKLCQTPEFASLYLKAKLFEIQNSQGGLQEFQNNLIKNPKE